MGNRLIVLATAIALLGDVSQRVMAAEVVEKKEDEKANLGDEISAAIKRALPIVAKAAENYPTHRKCFSCHHQTLPMLAVLSASEAGLPKNESLVKSQGEFTHASFRKQLDDLRKGEGIGGRALTVSYGLWTLRLADCPPDETTEAMVEFLLKTQAEDGHWQLHAVRPPMEESLATCAALSVAGLRHFATDAQRERADAAIAKARSWLIACLPENQEDRAARLWALHELQASADELGAARYAVVKTQREDGGWSQTVEMESDAYATGQALVVLHVTGVDTSAPEYQRGVEFLLKTQQPDGSWFVATRATPVQVLFDNGDPHGKNQFISTPATCWAIAALSAVTARPEEPK